MVTSGAVGVGRQRLRYRKLVNSSFADLQKPQMELDGKACAAVGQSGLMALYDMLFTQVCLFRLLQFKFPGATPRNCRVIIRS